MGPGPPRGPCFDANRASGHARPQLPRDPQLHDPDGLGPERRGDVHRPADGNGLRRQHRLAPPDVLPPRHRTPVTHHPLTPRRGGTGQPQPPCGLPFLGGDRSLERHPGELRAPGPPGCRGPGNLRLLQRQPFHPVHSGRPPGVGNPLHPHARARAYGPGGEWVHGHRCPFHHPLQHPARRGAHPGQPGAWLPGGERQPRDPVGLRDQRPRHHEPHRHSLRCGGCHELVPERGPADPRLRDSAQRGSGNQRPVPRHGYRHVRGGDDRRAASASGRRRHPAVARDPDPGRGSPPLLHPGVATPGGGTRQRPRLRAGHDPLGQPHRHPARVGRHARQHAHHQPVHRAAPRGGRPRRPVHGPGDRHRRGEQPGQRNPDPPAPRHRAPYASLDLAIGSGHEGQPAHSDRLHLLRASLAGQRGRTHPPDARLARQTGRRKLRPLG